MIVITNNSAIVWSATRGLSPGGHSTFGTPFMIAKEKVVSLPGTFGMVLGLWHVAFDLAIPRVEASISLSGTMSPQVPS